MDGEAGAGGASWQHRLDEHLVGEQGLAAPVRMGEGRPSEPGAIDPLKEVRNRSGTAIRAQALTTSRWRFWQPPPHR